MCIRDRVRSFGRALVAGAYDAGPAAPIPAELDWLRDRCAALMGREPGELADLLVTRYPPGAGIGWHRDRPDFADVIGISLLSPGTFRLRRRNGAKWERRSILAEPRSAYLLHGASRTEWEHSIPPLESLRYCITFRRLSARSRRECGE